MVIIFVRFHTQKRNQSGYLTFDDCIQQYLHYYQVEQFIHVLTTGFGEQLKLFDVIDVNAPLDIFVVP